MYHLHGVQVMPAGAVASGPQWQECVHNAFDFMWCVRALKVVGILPAWVNHYDLELYDLLYDLSAKVCGDGGVLLPGHRRTSLQPVVLRHGMHFALEHQRRQLAGGASRELVHEAAAVGGGGLRTLAPGAAPATMAATDSSTGESSIRWLSRQLGSPAVLRLCASACDVQQLLSRRSPKESSDNAAFANFAIRHGYLMLPASAASFVRLANSDARAWDLLLRQRYLSLRGSLVTTGKGGKQPKAGHHEVAGSVPPKSTEGSDTMHFSSLVGVGQVDMQPAILERSAADTARSAAELTTARSTAELTATEKAARRREQDRVRKQLARQGLKLNDPAEHQRQLDHANALRNVRRTTKKTAGAGVTDPITS